jgi:hypothetical protein
MLCFENGELRRDIIEAKKFRQFWRRHHMENKFVSLQRLVLCFLPLFALNLYVQAAASARLQLYFPIGLVVFLLYAWFVSTHINKIYPHPQRAIGQLCIIFLMATMMSINEMNMLKIKINKENINDHIYGLAVAQGKGQIASFMFLLLLISYLWLRFMSYRRTKIE